MKYSGSLKLKDIKRNENNEVVELFCSYSSEPKKLKGRIHWISDKDAVQVEVRLYDYLFKSENPMDFDDPLTDLNEKSLVVKRNALVNSKILKDIKHLDHFQFERLGYFAVDFDTNAEAGKYVFNLTVDLGDEKLHKLF